jgi:hypothetical protein
MRTVSVVSEVSDPATIIRRPLARALRTTVRIKTEALNDKSKPLTSLTTLTESRRALGSFRMDRGGRGSGPTPKSYSISNFLLEG